jgi:hypothetical protein
MYTKVVISLVDGLEQRERVVTDAAEVARVLECFPGFGQPDNRDMLSLLKPTLVVRFYHGDDLKARIECDGRLSTWDEGKGPNATHPGLRRYIAEVFGWEPHED